MSKAINKLCDLVEELIGPISCDESIQTHDVRMAVRDVRDGLRPGAFVSQGDAARDMWRNHEADLAQAAAKKGRAA